MIIKKRRVLCSCAILTALALTACNFPPEYVSKRDNAEKIEAVMKAIEREDTDELLTHFSSDMLDNHYDILINEIDEMYSYLDGKIVSYDDPTSTGYSRETVNYGDITYYHSSPDVKNVITEGGQELMFSFGYTVIDDENSENVGINQIRIFKQTENGGLGELQLNIDGKADNNN